MNDRFAMFANRVSQWTGKPVIFICAVALLIIWGAVWAYCRILTAMAAYRKYRHQILTFLMVFIIQNTQPPYQRLADQTR